MAKDNMDNQKKTFKGDAPEMDLSSAPAPIRKPIEWLKNYWYYYKMHVVLIVPMVLVVVVLIVSFFNKTSYDYTVVVSADFTAEAAAMEVLTKNLEGYLSDADGNGKLEIGASDLTLREDLSDEYYAQSYNKLAQMMVFDEVVFFIADDYSYEYLKEQGFIEPFSRLGVGADDEFALQLNGHALLEGTDLEKYGNWYLLVKVKTEINASDDTYIARREALADMIAALKSE